MKSVEIIAREFFGGPDDSTYDFDHDAQRETDLIDGTWAEQERDNDPTNKW